MYQCHRSSLRQVNMPMLRAVLRPPSLRDLLLEGLGEGLYGEPPRPDCYPHGYMTEHYNCSCWDDTIYKGPTCKESCVQVCLSLRGGESGGGVVASM
jgi:hypothetical protein